MFRSARAFFAAMLLGSIATAAEPRMNILLIMADDLGAGELACYGHPVHQTPNLDKLAATGAQFRTCWATPLCSPTRVEIMTGRYGFRTGWYNLIGRDFTPGDHLNPEEFTFADLVKSQGYVTGLAGKWQLGMITRQPMMIFDSGFDAYCTWAWKALPAGSDFAGEAPEQRYWHPAVIVNGRHRPTTPQDYGPDIYSNWLIDFMRENRKCPFLAYYPMCLTHQPHEPTPVPGEPGRQRPGSFQASVEYMDAIVGRLIDALDVLQLRSNTLVLFVGDNGSAGNGKAKVTELGVRVPLIANCPGFVKTVVSDELVDLSDVLPTIAELTGSNVPKDHKLDGRSFAPFLRGQVGESREWIFSYLRNQRMLRDRRWLLEGDGRFYDCGRDRDPKRYRNVTDSTDPKVAAAKDRFAGILSQMPAPTAQPATNPG